MAERTGSSNATHTEGASKAKKKAGSVLFWILGASALFAFYESFALLAIGMVPTLVAILVDRTRNRNAARTVAYINFAGCLPWLMDYWLAGGGIERVLNIVSDPFALLIMYTAAAAGWMLYFALRPVVAAYLGVAAEIKEVQLKRRQSQIVEIWGAPVREEAEASDLLDRAPTGDGAAALAAQAAD